MSFLCICSAKFNYYFTILKPFCKCVYFRPNPAALSAKGADFTNWFYAFQSKKTPQPFVVQRCFDVSSKLERTDNFNAARGVKRS